MIITNKQQAEMLEAALPLIKWMNENTDPHHTAIVRYDRIELLGGVAETPTDEFIDSVKSVEPLTEYEQLMAKIKAHKKP